jgi:hypothetical protein
MNSIKGIYTNGQVVLDDHTDWPEGCRVLVKPVPPAELVGMTEAEQGDDPESIAQWLAAFDAIPPLPMTLEDEAQWQAWRQQMKAHNVEAVRRQMLGEQP